MVVPFDIRLYGDPVLRDVATEVTEFDGKLAKLAADMLETMRAAPGIGLAAPQVGIKKRLFVWDLQDENGPNAIVNPTVVESSGEWVYEEGCLSIPDVHWEIVRPNQVHVTGFDLEGNEVSIEADELLGRLLQHETDHLDGILMVDRLDDDRRKAALTTLHEMFIEPAHERPKHKRRLRGLTLP